MTTKERRRLEASTWFAVVRAYQECTKRYARLLDAFDLTIPQFDALSAIARLGADATPKAIAEELVVTRGNVSGVLRRLQASGLVRTRNNEVDGRSFICELSAAGERRLDESRAAAAKFITEQFAPFDSATLDRTRALMRDMESHLRTMDADALAVGDVSTAAV